MSTLAMERARRPSALDDVRRGSGQAAIAIPAIAATPEPQHAARLRAGNPVPRSESQRRFETEHSVVTTQTGEQLGRAQHRVRAVAPVSDRASAAAVEPVPRIALTQQEACASLGCSEEFFVEHVRPHLRVVRRGRKRLFPVAELRRAVDEMAENVL